MKNVTLIGDSIRMGYQQFVEEALKDVARIWGPEINGGDSNNVRTHLPKWLETAADVIHLNCGLPDIKKDYDSGQPQVGVETHRENLCFIFDAVLAADRQLVWATTTPVNEDWHHERKGFDRFSADVDAYNAIALQEAQRRDLPIDDLHAVITEQGRDNLLVPDGVHFSDEGSRLLGQAVADRIRQLWEGI